MTPERFEEIKRISTGLGNIGLLAGIIAELIAEVTRLQLENEQLKFCYLEDAKTGGALAREIERLQAQNAELDKALKDCRKHLDYASEGRDDN